MLWNLKTAKFAILTLTRMHPLSQSIHLQMDNVIALSHLVKMGGTHNKVLSNISKQIWDYLLAKGITITTEYPPGAEKTKEIRAQNSQLLLSFIKPHGPVSTPTISRWIIMIVLNLSGIDTKTFTGLSKRTASSSKAKEAGILTVEILKRGFWSKKSTFEKFYYKGINTEDLSSFSAIYFEKL